MPYYEQGDLRLHFEVEGDGEPVLLIAAGGMRSANAIWQDVPWNPRAALSDRYQLIGMDQRNAGSSIGPVSGADGWHTYTADQLAVLDHLEVDRCHVLGMCIGGPYIFGLLNAAPERFRSAVMIQPVGIDQNADALGEMFDSWAHDIAPDHPEADTADWGSFRENMWGGEFVLTATTDEVAAIETPLLVLMGDDLYHPQATSRQIVELAPAATLIERWRDDDHLDATNEAIRGFLSSHPIEAR